MSDVRLSVGEPNGSNRASAGSVDVLLAFDLLVAASDAHLAAASAERTVVVASASEVGTGSMVLHPDTPFPGAQAIARLAGASRALHTVDAIGATTAALGSAATANVYLLGVAAQHGFVPISCEHLEEAIRLNGVAVDTNVAAFRLGRSDALIERIAGAPEYEATDVLVERLALDLVGYQSARYAERFRAVVARAASTDDDGFEREVAIHLHRLMAYKDEYEVARLLLSPESRARAEAVGGPGARIEWNLHPPMLRSLGLRRKVRLGRWARPLMLALRAGKRVRGTPFDLFGPAEVRRVERAMVHEYVTAVERLVDGYSPAVAAEAVAIASLPDQVRGYEHLKLERAERYRAELAERLAAFDAVSAGASPRAIAPTLDAEGR